MKVAFGVTQLARGLKNSGVDGIGHYTQELLNALQEYTDIELLPFSFGCDFQGNLRTNETEKLGRFDFNILKGLLLPNLRMDDLNGKKVDILHATDHLVPYVKNLPLIATLMDAIPLSNPEMLNNQLLSLSKLKVFLWRRISRRADHVITISEYSKIEISKWFEIPLEKISVVPLAVDSRFFNKISYEERMAVLGALNVPETYFLSVGTLQPRKNLERVLRATSLLPDDIKKTTPLVIVGRDGWGVDSLNSEIQQAIEEGWCIRLKHINDLQLRALLQSTKALIFPSLLEGFGLPILEAYASRTPVITSNTTSLPEAANGAAFLVDPLSVEDINEALMKVLENPILVASNIAKGYQHAKNMTWQKCAQNTLGIYHQVLK